MELLLFGTHPVLQDVLQLEGIVAELLAGCFWLLAIELEHLLLERRVYLHIFVGACTVFETVPCDRQRWRLVCGTDHLVDIPVCLQIGEVADAGIRAHAFRILIIPQGEGVVVAIGEDDGVTFFLERHQVVLSEVTAAVATGAVVVVPCLGSHLDGDDETDDSYDSGDDGLSLFTCQLELSREPVDDSGHTHTAPDGEGIERACIGVVALTWLHRCLVQVDDNGKSCHKEEEEHHPELADADGVVDRLLRAVDHLLALTGVPCLPEEAEETQNERHAIEHVMSLVLLQVIRQQRLVA